VNAHGTTAVTKAEPMDVASSETASRLPAASLVFLIYVVNYIDRVNVSLRTSE